MKRSGCWQELNMEFKINTNDFWRTFNFLYQLKVPTGFDLSLSAHTIRCYPEIIHELGLKLDDVVFGPGSHYYSFKIVDRKKWAIARLKYGC